MEPIEMIEVPSGGEVRFQEFLNGTDGDELTFYFRFVAPDLGAAGQETDPEETEHDMAHLCASFAVPRLVSAGARANRIVVSMADKETEFGIANPAVTQVFESYSVNSGACVWEPF